MIGKIAVSNVAPREVVRLNLSHIGRAAAFYQGLYSTVNQVTRPFFRSSF